MLSAISALFLLEAIFEVHAYSKVRWFALVLLLFPDGAAYVSNTLLVLLCLFFIFRKSCQLWIKKLTFSVTRPSFQTRSASAVGAPCLGVALLRRSLSIWARRTKNMFFKQYLLFPSFFVKS